MGRKRNICGGRVDYECALIPGEFLYICMPQNYGFACTIRARGEIRLSGAAMPEGSNRVRKSGARRAHHGRLPGAKGGRMPAGSISAGDVVPLIYAYW